MRLPGDVYLAMVSSKSIARIKFLLIWNGSFTGRATTFCCGRPCRSRICIHSPIAVSGFGKVVKVGYEDDKMVHKILNDWSSKLWWPHSEALYSLLLAYSITGNKDFLDMHSKVHDYKES